MIHLVTATNDAYALPLGVMLKSLFVNKTLEHPITIYILHGALSDKNKRNLEKVVRKYQQQPIFLPITDPIFSELRETHYITKEMYYRIAIPDLLDPEVKKALYLDCDLIVKEDISELWNTNIDDYFVAAVESICARGRKYELLIPDEYGYFNSGVLLINVEKWREHQIAAKVFEFIQTHPETLVHPDQDALNAILYNKWLPLDPKWNYTTGHATSLRLNTKPAIIHFTGKKKPWNASHPLAKQYFKYQKKVEWD
ncbi:glycosyltransferase family 8 protein [Geobacillus kaustophilus]|uniref:glycosyltransferase family 8 protein n=1 Tax=Geobacillus thermoleovorans group TaxID=1505648 RepID=UPI000B136FD4|nr:glycosyltransferase family 8 protein [Geobacillus kaustophilus]MED3667435.1 glycosyltransferase family 8 protein [Geobacillus kaustophilus]MED4972425.1 glycosyltransferase family 8 protein [Geobacillus thermoleovorans]